MPVGAMCGARRARKLDQTVPPVPVTLPGPADVAVVVARLDEIGEGQLVRDPGPRLALALDAQHGLHQVVRQHHPAQPQRGGEALAERAQVHDVLRVESLDGAHRLPVVTELPVVVVLQQHAPARARPVHRGGPSLGVERSSRGELVGGGEQGRPHSLQRGQLSGARAVSVQRQGHGPYPCRLQDRPVERQSVGLHGQGAAQHLPAEEQAQGVREAGAHDDRLGAGAYAPHAGQVSGEGAPQFGPPAGITGPERLVGRRVQRPPCGGQPGRTGEGGDVRQALPQVVGGRLRTGRHGFGHAWGRGRPRSGRHPGPRPLTGDQPALGDEFGVGLGDGVAGQSEVGGERPVGREPGARCQPSLPDRLAQRTAEHGAAAAASGRVQVQVQMEVAAGAPGRIDP
ncbi:hypothetical protein SGRIM128S_07946 [Streptomyces griseomycini]